MRKALALVRRPFTWLVAAEVAVIAALAVLAWHLLTHAPLPPPVDIQRAPQPPATRAPTVPTPPSSASAASPPVGMRWPIDLPELNRDGAALEAAEAAVVRGLAAGLRLYLERFVLPPVLHAESERTAITPAVTQTAAAARKMP